MKTLVWVEHEEGKLKDATLAVVTAASKLGEVHLIVAGQGVGGVAEQAAQIAGVGKVHVSDDAAYAYALAENVAPLIAQLMAGHDAILFPATTTGTHGRLATSAPASTQASRSARAGKSRRTRAALSF